MYYIKTTLLALFVSVATMAQKSITQQVYWIDNDIGAATAIATGTTLDVSAMAPGMHVLTMRVQDSDGLWSSPETRFFVVPHATTEPSEIVKREYWIDNEIAARTDLTDSPMVLSLLDLAPGVHFFTTRIKDNAGLWSVPETRIFIVPHAMVEATQIVEREYWIDNKVATRASLADSPAEIALLGLTPGMHSFTMRVKDDAGIWSVPESRFFITPTQAEQDGLTITQYMYWIDGDTLNFTSAAVSDPTAALPVTISHLDEGDHTISWRVADSKGTWSEAMTQSFTFTKTSITGDMITLTPATFEYSAEDITPEVTVADGESTLLEGEDYDLAISDNHDVGTATVTVTGKGAYKDTDNATFTITQAPLTVTADDKERHEDDEISPDLTITYSGWKGSDDESVLLTAPTIQCAVTADSPMGTYPITVSGGEARNYYLVYVNGIFTISEPVAVTNLKADTLDPDTKVFDLHGRPVIWRTAPKGIYIVNGRKVLK